MARINLLPWREELRKERQQQFQVVMGLAALLMVAVIALVHINMNGFIDDQNARNSYLDKQIKLLQKQIKEIKDLEDEKAKLLARMNIIQELQRSRPQVVHVFVELVQTLPDGVYLTSIKNAGSAITLDGFAESNARVSSYMRNVDKAEWLAKPRLNVIETTTSKNKARQGQRVSKFVLNVVQTSPKAATDEDEVTP